jgi:hypothetical protein
MAFDRAEVSDIGNLTTISARKNGTSNYENSIKDFRKNNNLPDPFSDMSFSGADITATIIIPNIGENGIENDQGDILEMAELQTISYSMHRENTPVRTLGHVNPRGFVKGSRTIAGSMIFTQFNEYAFYRLAKFRYLLADSKGSYSPLADMLPPFDVVFTFFNEYGLAAKMKIFGVTLVDEGGTMSIDDLITEQTYTYMARGIQPLIQLDTANDGMRYPDGYQAQKDERLRISTNAFGDRVQDYKNFIEKIYQP